MRKDWKYVIYLSVIILVYVVVKMSETKVHDWTITFAHQTKEPYGTYALNQLLQNFAGGGLQNSYKTIYELKDSLDANASLISLSTTFDAGREDVDALLGFIEGGGKAFIAAHEINGALADTLGLRTTDYFFERGGLRTRQDSSWLRLTANSFDTLEHYSFRRGNISRYLLKLDSADATVVARNNLEQPVTIKIAHGKGVLLVNTTPMVFTNINLMAADNAAFIEQSLSYLGNGPFYRTEFYHLGRMEAATPLRFVLNNEALRWAYYISIASVLLFMIFEAKRKQRIIPVMNAPANTSMEFVTTIGNLYYQNGDHKNIAAKKIQYFSDYVRTHYFINLNENTNVLAQQLAAKAGHSETLVMQIFELIGFVERAEKIDSKVLVKLNNLFEQFYRKHTTK